MELARGPYERLVFAKTDTWGIVELLDEERRKTGIVAVRGNMARPESVAKLRALVADGATIVGLSSYQNFPQRTVNPHGQSAAAAHGLAGGRTVGE